MREQTKPDNGSSPTFAELMSNLSVLKYLSGKLELAHEERAVCGWAKAEIERLQAENAEQHKFLVSLRKYRFSLEGIETDDEGVPVEVKRS